MHPVYQRLGLSTARAFAHDLANVAVMLILMSLLAWLGFTFTAGVAFGLTLRVLWTALESGAEWLDERDANRSHPR